MSKHNQLITSDDGSHTLISNKFGVSYHSTHGALQESITVFLAAGFHYARHNFLADIKVLEMGFGTGLNALLTLIEAEKYRRPVQFSTIEAYPISTKQADTLNYIEILDCAKYADAFRMMHNAQSGQTLQISKYCSFTKHITKIEDFEPIDKYNVVYYDAFAPTTQPELWDESMMNRIYDLLEDQAVFVSYCAKGSFKRALKAAGFILEPLPGPPGKREMTRALKG